MTRTVDVVIVGVCAPAVAAAVDAARAGSRVLVVAGPAPDRVIGALRRSLLAAGEGVRRRVTVVGNAEVVCVEGVDRVEAVLIRRLQTGRLIGVNASAVQVFEPPVTDV